MKHTSIFLLFTLLLNYVIAEENNEIRIVGAIGLNARLAPNTDSKVVLVLRPGVLLKTTSSEPVVVKGKKWLEIHDPRGRGDKYKKALWVVEEYIPILSSLKDHHPPREIWITMASERWSFYNLKPDGTYLYAAPEQIDGNNYACTKNQTLFKKTNMHPPYCVYKSKLKQFKNLVFGICGEDLSCNQTFVINKGSYCKLGDENTPFLYFRHHNNKIIAPYICESTNPEKWIKEQQSYFK